MIKNRAFTLAEVLITLGVIGVVAALTIPAVLNYMFEREAVSRAKETYALLAQAIGQWQEEGNCYGDSANCPELSPPEWPGGAYPHQGGTIAQDIAKYLKVSDAIYQPSFEDYKAKSWIPEDSYEMDGTHQDYTSLFPDIGKNITGCSDPGWGGYFLLPNGAVVKIAGIWWHYDVVFDINGAKKPNRIGKDQFPMSLFTSLRKTFNPYYYSTYGSGYGVCAENDVVPCSPDDGHSPMAYVLKYDKLPDLKKMGYPSSP